MIVNRHAYHFRKIYLLKIELSNDDELFSLVGHFFIHHNIRQTHISCITVFTFAKILHCNACLANMFFTKIKTFCCLANCFLNNKLRLGGAESRQFLLALLPPDYTH